MNFSKYKSKVIDSAKCTEFEMKPSYGWVNSRIDFPYKIVNLLNLESSVIRTPKTTTNKKGATVPVKYIAPNVFCKNPNITDIILDSDTLFEIRENVLKGCSNLTRIYIPKSITHIYHGAFKDCQKLKEVYYEGSEVDWNNINIETSKKIINNKDNLGLICRVEEEKIHGNEPLLKAKKYFNCNL